MVADSPLPSAGTKIYLAIQTRTDISICMEGINMVIDTIVSDREIMCVILGFGYGFVNALYYPCRYRYFGTT